MTSRLQDEDILDIIFNPELQGVSLDAFKAPPEDNTQTGPAIDPSLLIQVRTLEARAILAAESNNFESALSLLSEALTLCPVYASGYNNRAQVYQLLKQPDQAMADCNRAIEHAHGDRTVLKQAYTQRGMLYRAKDEVDAARADLEKGAAYGNKLAKKEAVKLNPYAALCNQYLQQALDKHWSGLGETKKEETTAEAAPAAAADSQQS